MVTNLVRPRAYAVYWEFDSRDDYGRPLVNSPVEIRVNVEEVTAEDRATTSQNIDYDKVLTTISSDLIVGSQLWIGKLIDLPSPIPLLYEVVWFEKAYTLDQSKVSRTAGLKRYSSSSPSLA